LALVATLRAAAPWQGIRRAARRHPSNAAIAPPRPLNTPVERRDESSAPIAVRREDFRLHRYAERRESTIIFLVDASGSAALHRLAEAKGAVQLLLAEAYAERTSAALIVFRGTAAEVLLPPTRSLARAKTLLAALPGGGATPLAAGLALGLGLAEAERRKGRDPTLVLFSDGRANVAQNGLAGRAAAMEDARAAARAIAMAGIRSIFIDTSPRPSAEADSLAHVMAARYVALPYVEARAVRETLRALA
jgi:magnesium chelatase subunit D